MRARIFLATFICLLAAPPAWACSCVHQSPEAFAAEIAILFDGALIGTEPLSVEQHAACAADKKRRCFAPLVGIFRVDEAYKGALGSEVRINFRGGSSAACGIAFEPGQPVTVAARGDAATGYTTNLCTQYPVRGEPTRSRVIDAARNPASQIPN